MRPDLLKTKEFKYEAAVQTCLIYQDTFPDLYGNTEGLKQIPSEVVVPMEIDRIINEVQLEATAHSTSARTIAKDQPMLI